MKLIHWFSAVVMMMVMAITFGCAPDRDRVTNVQWMGDGAIAVVTVKYADNDEPETFKITCQDNNVDTPFSYIWENDCDLNTEWNGFVRDWDNPDDERFERNNNRGYRERGDRFDDNDDDERYSDNDGGLDLGDVAIGAMIGSAFSGSNKSTTKRGTTYKRTTTRKTPTQTPRTSTRTTTRRTTRR